MDAALHDHGRTPDGSVAYDTAATLLRNLWPPLDGHHGEREMKQLLAATFDCKVDKLKAKHRLKRSF